jgi:thioredoxin reductase
MSIKMERYNVDIAVIGAGPAGLAAALSANKEGVSVMIIERDREMGGILQQCIHNGFGLRYFKQELTGPEYAQRFINLIYETNIQVLLNSMVINLTSNHLITAINPQRGVIQIQAKAVVLAMGCRERTRGAINVPGGRPAGIFPAGQAQRFINMEGYFPGKRILILGSGDIGMIMARRCMLEGLQVLAVAEVLPYPTGLIRNQVQCLQEYNIPLYLKHTIVDIEGKYRVEGATIAEVDDKWYPIPGTEKHFDCDTILFSVGLIPENEISQKAGCILSGNGGPEVNEFLETSISGIFACGNVLQVHDLVDWVTLEGERAAQNAVQYVNGKSLPYLSKTIKLIPGKNIGYVKPDRINVLDSMKQVEISFRVKIPKNHVTVELITKGKAIYSRKYKYVIPSEMIIIKTNFKPEEIQDSITINIVEEPITESITPIPESMSND